MTKSATIRRLNEKTATIGIVGLREHTFDLKSEALTPAVVSGYDLVLIATNHDKFDYTMILENARLIVDTRGMYLQPTPNVVKA